MNAMRIVAAACVLLIGSPLFAQEWDRYQNLDDRFAVTARASQRSRRPSGSPSMLRCFPAAIYRWQQGANRYSVTVVDYSDSEAIYTANQHSADFQASFYWQIDILDRSVTRRRSTGRDPASK